MRAHLSRAGGGHRRIRSSVRDQPWLAAGSGAGGGRRRVVGAQAGAGRGGSDGDQAVQIGALGVRRMLHADLLDRG